MASVMSSSSRDLMEAVSYTHLDVYKRQVLDQMRPQRAVMVGDRKGDFLAGRDNGLPTVSACYGYGLPDEWALADRQAYSVEKLQNMLLDFTQGGA